MHFDWGFFQQLLFHPPSAFIQGAGRTIYLAVIAQALGVGLGLWLALCRRSRHLPLRVFASGYIWLIRGTPLLVQAVIIYDGTAAMGLYSFHPLTIGGLSVPGVVQVGVGRVGGKRGDEVAEMRGAASSSVEKGQSEAAESVGMRRRQAMRHVVLPQAMRVVIPPLGNEFNNMLKVTSLLSVIGLQELFLAAQDYNSTTFRTFEIFLVAAIYYILMTTVWSFIQSAIERRLESRGGDVVGYVSLRQRLFGGGALIPGEQMRGAR